MATTPQPQLEPCQAPPLPPPQLPELPADVLTRILAELHLARDVCNAGASCRLLHTATRTAALWEQLVHRAFPTAGLREVHSRCFRGRKVVDPFSLESPQPLLATLLSWCVDSPGSPPPTGSGADADADAAPEPEPEPEDPGSDWRHIFRTLTQWPFPAKVVRYGADETSLLYMFESPPTNDTPPAGVELANCSTAAPPAMVERKQQDQHGGDYNLFARTSGQTNHVHKGRWTRVAGQSAVTWRLSPAGSSGSNYKLAVFSRDYTQVTISSGSSSGGGGGGGGSGGGSSSESGRVPFHSSIPPLWRKVVEKDSLLLQLGHSKRM